MIIVLAVALAAVSVVCGFLWQRVASLQRLVDGLLTLTSLHTDFDRRLVEHIRSMNRGITGVDDADEVRH